MNEGVIHNNEDAAIEAFNRQAPVFDKIYSGDTIIQYKRKRVHDHVDEFLPAGSHILELNAGTGEDAIYFANKGHRVHATDASAGMQEMLKSKVKQAGLDNQITHEICSFTQLENLQDQGPYDLVFSNFAGLNCTNKMNQVLDSFPFLVKPGGFITLVILPRFCLWEFLLLFKGKFKTAFRRFSGSSGAKAKVEGVAFRCWYYNPSYITKRLKDSFSVYSIEGLCTIVPPSYLENFAEKHSSLYRYLVKQENKRKSSWPWRVIGDYYILTLKRR